MNKTKKLYLAVLSTVLISGIGVTTRLNVEASEKMEQTEGVELNVSLDQTERIISGEAVNLDFMPFGTAANPTTTTGNGKFWVVWTRPDQFRSHHSNPTHTHRSSASNISNTIRSTWHNRGASGTNGVQVTITASLNGNKANWDIALGCTMNGTTMVCAP